tara:strand:- start:12686 stop:12934 length:249 start_codon:yes stop_codon:yes gene_type:complete
VLRTFRDDGVDYKYPVIPALKTTFIPKIKIFVIPAGFWAGISLPVLVEVKQPLQKGQYIPHVIPEFAEQISGTPLPVVVGFK